MTKDTITRRRFAVGGGRERRSDLAAGRCASYGPAHEARRGLGPQRGRRRRRRRLGRADRGSQDRARREVGPGLEARDRVGGRVWNHDLGRSHVSERGGTFVGPTQDRVLALATDLGVGTFPTYDTGQNVYVADGQRITWSDTGPTGTAPPDPLALPDLAAIVAALDQMSKSVPVSAPWTAQNAAQWDGQTLETWVNGEVVVTPRFRELLPVATRPIFGAEPREVSLLFVLFYIASSGNAQNAGTFERNFDTRDGAQQSRFIGGSQTIARAGTETSDYWNGYMDGAVRSGERAAAEVLAEL